MAISLDTIRVGKKYFLINYGERIEFTVVEKMGQNNYKLKDLYSLELFELKDLLKYGKSKDYELREL